LNREFSPIQSPVNSSPDMPQADEKIKKELLLDTGETICFKLSDHLYVVDILLLDF